MIHEVEKPFETHAFSAELLEMLRLLCEGHNEEMQDFLRVQPNQASTHDLVTEV